MVWPIHFHGTRTETKIMPPSTTEAWFAFPGADRLEFHRQGVALLPDPADITPGVALFIFDDKETTVEHRACTCLRSRRRTCDHLLSLAEFYKTLMTRTGRRPLGSLFQQSLFADLAGVLGDRGRPALGAVSIKKTGGKNREHWLVLGDRGEELIRYYSTGLDALRLAERLNGAQAPGSRSELLSRLFLATLSGQEHFLLDKGHKSFRILLEESFWFRFAYHLFREFGGRAVELEPAVNQNTGAFTVTIRIPPDEPIARLAAPRDRVRALLEKLAQRLPNQAGLAIHPAPLEAIYHINETTELDLEVRQQVVLRQQGGKAQYLDGPDFGKFRYGDLVYLPDLGIMAELEQKGRERTFRTPQRMVLAKSQVVSFLDDFKDEIREGRVVAGNGTTGLTILTEYDRLEIVPDALNRDWLWMDIRYGFGDESISLAELIVARRNGQRYIRTAKGWVDSQAPVFDVVDQIRLSSSSPNGGAGHDQEDQRTGITPRDFLRLTALCPHPVQVSGPSQRVRLMEKLLDLEPAREVRPPAGLLSKLRGYQRRGYQWLHFLWENRLGGILADDMGLGKTHQALALLVRLAKEKGAGPMLVVAPATVLPHWEAKIRAYAPDLAAAIHYGPNRNLTRLVRPQQVILTTYGVLRQDGEEMAGVTWAAVVLDEIQNLKNPKTLAYEAARKLSAGFWLGLTGTPLENRLEDLKALFDVVLPGYLGADAWFRDRYAKAVADRLDPDRTRELGRLIGPFVLRRTKAAVLTELPPKIEDARTCELSEEQVRLYRGAVEKRGRDLVRQLQESGEPVPYIHIFALLGMLKQICDHPALVAGDPDRYTEYESGKWDLFTEILDECLGSGAKVVVYSQYLDMIRIIGRHLSSQGVGHVVLTGQSRDRGGIVDRFQNDPETRVFVGSLMAGGVGIDLVAASVVIHYDRWWNAAREDQATDRVHRIGQRRGVQVFKLVTRGTLEEKINALIEKKRRLMNQVIEEDSAEALKSLGREELIELMSFSG